MKTIVVRKTIVERRAGSSPALGIMEIFLQAIGGVGLLGIGCFLGFKFGFRVGRLYGFDECKDEWQAFYDGELNGKSQSKPSER